MKNIALIIGRFQLPHRGHFHLFETALQQNDHLIIAIGSHNSPRDIRNPFETEDIKNIINMYFDDDRRISYIYVEDHLYMDAVWANEITKKVMERVSEITDQRNITLYGHEKDDTSYYLKMFPYWKYIDVEPIHKEDGGYYNATDFRTTLYERIIEYKSTGLFFSNFVDLFLPFKMTYAIKDFLECLAKNESLDHIVEDYIFCKKYKEKFKDYDFPPIFVTCDSVCISNDHILLIKRKNSPCKGSYALAGGFLDQNETIENGIIRELYEETMIDISIDELKKCMKKVKVFDIPNRSMRGRTVTHAGLFILPATVNVVANDDAKSAFWFPLDKLHTIKKQFMEDHYHVIVSILIGFYNFNQY